MSVMRSAGVRSTLASFIEVTLFFCVLSPMMLTTCYLTYHVIHGPVSQKRQAADLAELMTTAGQAAEDLTELRELKTELDPESPLARQVQAFATAASVGTSDPVDLAGQADRTLEMLHRKVRQAADDLETAAEYALESSRAAAEQMMDEPVERTTRLFNTAKATQSYSDAAERIWLDVLNDYDPEIAGHYTAAGEAMQLIYDANKRIAVATEALDSEDEGQRLQAELDIEDSEAAKTEAQATVTNAYAQIALLDPLPAELHDLALAVSAMDEATRTLVEEAETLNTNIQDITAETVDGALADAKDGQDASSLMRDNRVQAGQTLAETAPTLDQAADEVVAAVAEITARCEAATEWIHRSDPDRAKDRVWTVRRLRVASDKVARRANRIVGFASLATDYLTVPGQPLSTSINQGLGSIRLGSLVSGGFPFLDIRAMFASLPWWMWVLVGLAYSLFVTIYWVPSGGEADRHEVKAMAWFTVFAVILAGVAFHQTIWEQAVRFWEIANGQL